MRRLISTSAILATAACLGGCVAPSEPVPAPAPPRPTPTPAPVPAPAPAPPPRSVDWRDWPLTPGTWAWRRDARGSIALFGAAGADAELTLRCDRERGRIYLSRRGAAVGPAQLTVRTSSTLRSLAMAPTGGTPAYLAAEFGPRDSLLDAIGYSRGKVVVEGAGLPTLVVPAWAEILRVVEDCR
jgi:hypothetical protein